MTKDYLRPILQRGRSPEFKHHGIKGQKWGVRRSRSQLRSASAAQAPSHSKPGSKTEAELGKGSASSGSKGHIQDHVETSQARYNRLREQAKAGRANEFTEQDLKFFNARTEALSKIQKMNEKKPGWIQDTSKQVLQNTGRQILQDIATASAQKYISGPIIEGIKKGASASHDDLANGEKLHGAVTTRHDKVVEAARRKLKLSR